MRKVAMSFSRPFEGDEPLAHIGFKLSVYLDFFDLLLKQGWEGYVVTRKTYQADGVFDGAWRYQKRKFVKEDKRVRMDLIYDRTGGLKFPPKKKEAVVVVNNRDFKELCADKWLAWQELNSVLPMPKTFLVGEKKNLPAILSKMEGDWVVLKPLNGLKGLGIFVGPKKKAVDFEFDRKYSEYIVQEFVDTSGGFLGLVEGFHDLRVVIINGKIVWSHLRTPPKGSFKANVAQGGDIKEVSANQLPEPIREASLSVAKLFLKKYNNPLFSVDYGLGLDGPKVFEINDQIGFPAPNMEQKNLFLQELVANFAQKLKSCRQLS